MDVIYAVNARLAGGGIGDHAYHAARAIHQGGYLRRLVVSSSKTSEFSSRLLRSMGYFGRILKRAAIYDHSGYKVDHIGNTIFDHWSRVQLCPVDLFHGWMGSCHTSLKRAKAMGAITVVEAPIMDHPSIRKAMDKIGDRYGFVTPTQHYRQRISLQHRSLSLTDYLLVGSDFVRKGFESLGFQDSKMLVIPYGVDLKSFTPSEREGDTASIGTFRILFVGEVCLRKGVLDLLEAWKSLAWRAAELYMAGRVHAEIRPYLSRYVDDPNIHFLGHVPVKELYQSSDLFVFPSHIEGSAKVTYEAMASGLPMITTPNAGSVARHEQEALIVHAGDVPALKEAMCRLRDDAGLRARLKEAARKRVEAYTWEDYGKRLLGSYSQILGKTSLP